MAPVDSLAILRAGAGLYTNPDGREDARRDASLLLSTAPPGTVPEAVHHYYGLLPLEADPASPAAAPRSSTGGPPSVVYKAVSTVDGLGYVLRRYLGAPLARGEAIVAAVESWKRIRHPGVVALREAFTSRAFALTRSPLPAANELVLPTSCTRALRRCGLRC